MEMENVVAEAIFDFNPTDSIELTLKVRVVFVRFGGKDLVFCIDAARNVLIIVWFRIELFLYTVEGRHHHHKAERW